MQKSAAARWWVPLAVGLGVLGLLLGMHAAVAGGSNVGGGPEPDRRLVDDALPILPTAQPQPLVLGPGTVHLTGYRPTPQGLLLSYTIEDRECTKLVLAPLVTETTRTVRVVLTRVPAPDAQLFSCPTGPLRGSMQIPLTRPLGGRPVLDGANEDLAVQRGGR